MNILKYQQAVTQVFKSLNQSEVRYAVWKDIPDINTFPYGNAELDILVHPPDRQKFKDIAFSSGYAEFTNFVDPHQRQITHFLRFYGGRHFHLHVHYALFTGDHASKEYCLNSLFDEEIFDGPVHHGIRTVNPNDELLIGMIRIILKSDTNGGIRKPEQSRILELFTEERFELAIRKLGRVVQVPGLWRERLHDCLKNDGMSATCLQGLSETLYPLRRISVFESRWLRLKVRWAGLLTRLVGLANKRLSHRAPIIAIIGVDGSGKSTLAKKIHEVIAAKASVRLVYIGGNRRTYSLWTRICYVLWGGVAVLKRRFPDSSLLLDISKMFQALFEYAKCLDRTRRIRKCRRWANRGIIIICERYPVIGLFDYPRIAIEARNAGGEVSGELFSKFTKMLLKRIDSKLESEGLADVTVLIDTSFEAIATRRTLKGDEEQDIRWKLDVLNNFKATGGAGQFLVISNDGTLCEALSELCDEINAALCIFNSSDYPE